MLHCIKHLSNPLRVARHPLYRDQLPALTVGARCYGSPVQVVDATKSAKAGVQEDEVLFKASRLQQESRYGSPADVAKRPAAQQQLELERDYLVAGAPVPRGCPQGYPQTSEPIQFNPAVHLQLEPPAYVKTLIDESKSGTDKVPFPVPLRAAESGGVTPSFEQANGGFTEWPGLAYTAPFRVLSDEGVRVMRDVIAAHESYAMSNERIPMCLRGLGYLSQFARDFAYSPEVLDWLSHMSGTPMHPHDMPMNIAHVNVGQIGNERNVDEWHLDSVPYVMVVLLSDATEMQGGELQVARLRDPHEALEKIRTGRIDPSMIDTVNYPGPGYAIFMQGSYIAHSVTPVRSAREPRLSLVNSYQNRDRKSVV